MPEVTVVQTFSMRGMVYTAGAKLELTDEEAADLAGRGLVELGGGKKSPPPAPPVVLDERSEEILEEIPRKKAKPRWRRASEDKD